MENKALADYASEIKKIGSQISELNKQQEEIKKNLTAENSTFAQLQKEQEYLLNEIKSIGFFNFKEKKPFKEKLEETRTKIHNNKTA
jgi:septation ring formation regulator EzrA